jgi:hypothetical protein
MARIYKLLLFGDRNWSNASVIERELLKVKARLKPGVELLVIHGGAPGADQEADLVAHALDCHTARVDALWNTRYRGAGPQRNEIMLRMKPDEAIGFHKDIAKSKGTKDMARRLDKAGIRNRIVKR